MKVKFLPQDIELEIERNQTVLDLAEKNGIFIKSVCRGVPNCAECRVRVVDGEHNLLPPSKKETALIGTAHFVDGRRLSCQLICFGDITVDLTEQIEKSQKEQKFKRQKEGSQQEGMESKALAGNLIDEHKDILVEAEKELEKELHTAPASSSSRESKSSSPSSQPQKKKNNKKRNQKRNRRRR